MDQLKKDALSLVEYLTQKDVIKDYIVVGSLSLEICGMSLRRKPHDIDIEVVVKDQNKFKTVIEALVAASPKDVLNIQSYPGDGHNSPYIFKFGESIVNLWSISEESMESRTFVYKDYVKYSGVMDTLAYKRNYCREKDLADVMYIINHLSAMSSANYTISEHKSKD